MPARLGRPWPRVVSMSRTGRFVALRTASTIDLVDAIGTAPRQTLALDGALDFCCVGTMLWILRPGHIARHALDGGRQLDPVIDVPASTTALEAASGPSAHTALTLGPNPVLAHGLYDRVGADAVDPDAAAFALQGRRVVIADGQGLRLIDLGRGDAGRIALAEDGEVRAVSSLFGGRAVAALTRGEASDLFWVLRPTGSFIHKVIVPRTRRWAIAENRGVAVLGTETGELVVVDLRYGRVQSEAMPPIPVRDLDVDADGQYVVLAGPPEASGAHPVIHAPATDLFSASATARRAALHSVSAAPTGDEVTAPEPGATAVTMPAEPPGSAREADLAVGHSLSPGADLPPVDAADAEPPPSGEEPPPAEPIVVPDLIPIALGLPLPPLTAEPHPDWPPYASAREHLDDMLDLVSARAARAIADAWNSGRLSIPTDESRPFEREVRALLGHVGGFALDLLAESEERLARLSARAAGRARSSIAAGLRLPFVELSREFRLSSNAAHVLMVAMAPNVRGEIARLFGILGNDENRPIVDRFLIEIIIAGEDLAMRSQVARELSDDAPLVRYGLLRINHADVGGPLFGAITVDGVLIDRIRGHAKLGGGGGDLTTVRRADRSLDALHIPDAVKRDLVLALANARRDDTAVRVVLRGRRGAGRHSLVAALADRVGRAIACIDCHRFPRAAKLMAVALRQELIRALIRGCVPVVSGLEAADPSDAEGQDLIKQILRAHPGPIAIRAAPEASLPLDPGYVTVSLPNLSESERTGFWREALARAGVICGDVDGLAARYRIGPGVIENIIQQLKTRRVQENLDANADAGAMLEDIAGQHIATRLAHIATHVARRAKWEQVALADDVIDSVREFIARIAHRKTVYENWGFDAKMQTSRGLTALFYGPPGTGKSMVAGLIARELGLELYRVDLARIVSKWIGETEKNLAEIFDAAEDGQVVILFDEADSLFAKRTEVKSSVDRYANLEVNYLLQRLDSFEGIAILTTNLEGSIDQAFKRRMSLRLHFPFPDEEMRVRLWAAHIPVEAPIAGDFDFPDLARRFPLSGGYIRNSTLRAAFLAAQEQRPLGHEHLLRAIALEYREMGKLATSGRME